MTDQVRIEVPTVKVPLTYGQISRILEWSTAAGDTWGDEWSETDHRIVEILEEHA